MAGAPLKLDWNELLPGRDEAPPPEVEVVAEGGAGRKEDGATEVEGFADLSDHQLQEKIQRLQEHVHSAFLDRLPDRGAKLHSSLRQSLREQQRRNILRLQKDSEKSEKARPSKTTGRCDSASCINSNVMKRDSEPKSSFTLHFAQKLEEDVRPIEADAAFDEKLRLLSRTKIRSSSENELKGLDRKHPVQISSQSARISSRELPFQCLVDKNRKRSLENGCREIECSTKHSFHEERNLSRGISKRKRASDSQESLDIGTKVEDVVLLDDDAQIIQPSNRHTFDDWKEHKIYYPSRDDPEAVELSYADIKCLDPESYLSSPIMNFYIQYLQRSALSSLGRTSKNYHIFNTYFYGKLKDAVSCKVDRAASFLKLRRWWKGVNIFEKAYIFLPIHGNEHWSLVIICNPALEDESGPIILHLDSLRIHPSDLIFDVVDRYLRDEWEYIDQNAPPSDLPFSRRIWKRLSRRIENKMILVPQQKNVYDCGLFVLYFMERFIREAPERLKRKDLGMFGTKWFKPEEASGLRRRMRELLIEEFENARLENGAESPHEPTSPGSSPVNSSEHGKAEDWLEENDNVQKMTVC